MFSYIALAATLSAVAMAQTSHSPVVLLTLTEQASVSTDMLSLLTQQQVSAGFLVDPSWLSSATTVSVLKTAISNGHQVGYLYSGPVEQINSTNNGYIQNPTLVSTVLAGVCQLNAALGTQSPFVYLAQFQQNGFMLPQEDDSLLVRLTAAGLIPILANEKAYASEETASDICFCLPETDCLDSIVPFCVNYNAGGVPATSSDLTLATYLNSTVDAGSVAGVNATINVIQALRGVIVGWETGVTKYNHPRTSAYSPLPANACSASSTSSATVNTSTASKVTASNSAVTISSTAASNSTISYTSASTSTGSILYNGASKVFSAASMGTIIGLTALALFAL